MGHYPQKRASSCPLLLIPFTPSFWKLESFQHDLSTAKQGINSLYGTIKGVGAEADLNPLLSVWH